MQDETDRLQKIIATISKNWAEGFDGNFSANWDENDASAGFWLPAENAERIAAALTGKIVDG